MGASAPLAIKVLGPTADYVGDELQQWTELRVRNLQRIFEAAERKLGDDGLDQPGRVPPRVLKEILAEGSYCDDELGAEYFGGVLAASRTEVERDDRSAALAALIGRLSAYQLRTHYVLYEHARRLLNDPPLALAYDLIRRDEGPIFMPYTAWEKGMDLSSIEGEQAGQILQHALFGLMREDLLEKKYTSARKSILTETYKREFPSGGFVYTITMHGVELFSRAQGVSGKFLDTSFTSPTADFEVMADVAISSDSIRLVDLPMLGEAEES